MRELAGVFLQHHGHALADRERQPFGTAHQDASLALQLERTLAHRAGEDVEQSVVHSNQSPVLKALMRASTRSMSAAVSPSVNSAVTGTYQQRSSAKAAHFTASFSVMSTGSWSPKFRSPDLKAWWSGMGCSYTVSPALRSMSKKRCGLPMAATACTPAPRKLDSERSAPPPATGRASPGRICISKLVPVTSRGSWNPAAVMAPLITTALTRRR